MTEIVLGVDPGDVHNGLVSIDGETGALRGHHTLPYHELIGAIEGAIMIHNTTEDNIHICMEVFQLYPHQTRNQAWNTFPVIEIIGVVKYLAAQNKINLIMGRPPDVNRFMKKRSVPSDIPRSGGGEHQVSAYRLAEYYRIMYLPEALAGSYHDPYGR